MEKAKEPVAKAPIFKSSEVMRSVLSEHGRKLVNKELTENEKETIKKKLKPKREMFYHYNKDGSQNIGNRDRLFKKVYDLFGLRAEVQPDPMINPAIWGDLSFCQDRHPNKSVRGYINQMVDSINPSAVFPEEDEIEEGDRRWRDTLQQLSARWANLWPSLPGLYDSLRCMIVYKITHDSNYMIRFTFEENTWVRRELQNDILVNQVAQDLQWFKNTLQCSESLGEGGRELFKNLVYIDTEGCTFRNSHGVSKASQAFEEEVKTGRWMIKVLQHLVIGRPGEAQILFEPILEFGDNIEKNGQQCRLVRYVRGPPRLCLQLDDLLSGQDIPHLVVCGDDPHPRETLNLFRTLMGVDIIAKPTLTIGFSIEKMVSFCTEKFPLEGCGGQMQALLFAGRHHIFPTGHAASGSRHYVIKGQIPQPAAILAGKFIA